MTRTLVSLSQCPVVGCSNKIDPRWYATNQCGKSVQVCDGHGDTVETATEPAPPCDKTTSPADLRRLLAEALDDYHRACEATRAALAVSDEPAWLHARDVEKMRLREVATAVVEHVPALLARLEELERAHTCPACGSDMALECGPCR